MEWVLLDLDQLCVHHIMAHFLDVFDFECRKPKLVPVVYADLDVSNQCKILRKEALVLPTLWRHLGFVFLERSVPVSGLDMLPQFEYLLLDFLVVCLIKSIATPNRDKDERKRIESLVSEPHVLQKLLWIHPFNLVLSAHDVLLKSDIRSVHVRITFLCVLHELVRLTVLLLKQEDNSRNLFLVRISSLPVFHGWFHSENLDILHDRDDGVQL